MEEYARNGVPEECSRQLTYICMQRKTPSYRGADYHRIISTAETHADPLVCPGGLTHRIRDPSQDPDVHWTFCGGYMPLMSSGTLRVSPMQIMLCVSR